MIAIFYVCSKRPCHHSNTNNLTVQDAVLDAVCEEEPFLDGFAHKGILSGARVILAAVQEQLVAALASHPDYGLVITGHSLGAGTAILLALDLLAGPIVSSARIRCLALAPPPVFRSINPIAQPVNAAIDILVNNSDCVPRLSLASVARLLASLRAVDQLGLSVAEQLAVLAGRPGPEVRQTAGRVRAAVERARQDKFPPLEHPGRIHHLVKQGDSHGLHRSDSKVFTEAFLLVENMIADHLHTSYQATLGALR